MRDATSKRVRTGALAALLCVVLPAAAEPPKPLLWQVSDGDNSIYLLGSFHLLTPADYPLAPAVEAAYADAERLVFELPPAQLGDPASGQKMLQKALRRDGSTLQGSLPAALWQKLQAHCQARGLPLAQWQGFEVWFVALLVSMHEMQKVGLDPALGLDRHFVSRGQDGQKPSQGLETLDDQLQVFSGMTADEQQQSLQEVLDKGDAFEADIRALHTLWRAGDGKRLYSEMGLELQRDYPALYQRVQRDRNLAWLPQLRALLDQQHEDDALVVVGAMHLLGPDGLVALLGKAGYRVSLASPAQ